MVAVSKNLLDDHDPDQDPDSGKSSLSDSTIDKRAGTAGPGSVEAANEPLSRSRRRSERPLSKNQLANSQEHRLLIYRQGVVIALTAELLDAQSFAQAKLALINRIHSTFRCDRAALAMSTAWHRENDSPLELAAISQQSTIDSSTAESRMLTAVLQESADRQRSILWPEEQNELGILTAHRAMASGRNNVRLRSVPMYHQEKLIASVLIEMDDEKPWSAAALGLLDQMLAVSAPILAMHLENGWSVGQTLTMACRGALNKLFGSNFIGLKSLVFVTAVALVCAAMWPTKAQVVASAEVIPTERRLLVAPFDGFIDSVLVRAGDLVAKGQPLLRFDTRELDLQISRQLSDIQKASAEFRVAMAEHDRKSMATTQAQLARARAEHALLLQQLARAEVRSPRDGIVLSDALDHAIGSPVARGATLLQLAPQKGQEVHLLVDESDILQIASGQTGLLTLRSAPGETVEFVVKAVHPIAEASSGRSRFRVTADLQAHNESNSVTQGRTAIRPGQTGVARIDTGSTVMIDRLSEDLLNWFQRWWWVVIG